MEFKIPFTFSKLEKLKKRSKFFSSKIRYKKKSFLGESLENSGIGISREEYLGICIKGFITSFLLILIILFIVLAFLKIKYFYLISLGISFLFSSFMFFSRIVYPKVYVTRKQRNIERSLIPALEDILIQLNSGIPLFSILVNISEADYGELSFEFKKAVKRISSGEPESEVLNEIGKRNPSIFFRRTLWQLSNGLNVGSDMSIVVKDSIKSLNEEQLIEIQEYGNKLNPLVMLYMLLSVIIPSLSIAFLTIVTSMLGITKTITSMLFIILFVFVVFFQLIFLGIIKSKRPRLL